MKVIYILLSFSFLFSQTESQVEEARKVILQNNLNESQVREIAKSQGFSNDQIESAIKKEGLGKPNLNGSGNIDNDQQIDIETSLQESESVNEKNSENFDKNDEVSISKTQTQDSRSSDFFGYEIFKRDPALFQASSAGAVDPSYNIGPNDDIIVTLWGETQFRQVLTVDKEGFIFIPEVGQVSVNGLNLNLLEAKLFRVLSQSYASLNPKNRNPTTFLDVSLGNLRPLRIQVLGQVKQPGAYLVNPAVSLFSSLYYFDGPTTTGSLRDIQLIRNNKKIVSVDFYDYLLTGKRPNDQKLQLDDVVFIPQRLNTVELKGEIVKNGKYEFKSDEGLRDLILIAGGLQSTAYLGRCQIDRVVPFEEREEKGMERMIIDVDLTDFFNSNKNIELQDGDKIEIFSINDIRKNIVQLSGSVLRPGTYHLSDSLKLSQLINKAEGLLGDAMNRADIIRTNPDFSVELIKVDLKLAMGGDSKNDLFLKNFDRIKVFSSSEMIDTKSVSINGQVKKPGTYPLYENTTLYDLIFKTGGFLDEEFKKSVFLDRADLIRIDENGINFQLIKFNLGKLLKNPNTEANIFLKPSDAIFIYKKDLFLSNRDVKIFGEIKNEGSYIYKPGMNIKDIILESGGLTKDFNKFKVSIFSAETSSEKFDKFGSVKDFNFDSDQLLKSNEHSNDGLYYKISPHDIIVIFKDPYFYNERSFSLAGEVLYPGLYPILSSKERVSDIIERAFGLKPEAYPFASTFIRNGEKISINLQKILKNKKSKHNFVVKDGDQLIIPSKPNIVRVTGAVNNANNYHFLKGKRAKYYIALSGNLSTQADRKNIWIEYPNGSSKKYNRLSILSPKIYDGSTIVVGNKEKSEPFDATEFSKELASIISNFAQALTFITLLFRQ